MYIVCECAGDELDNLETVLSSALVIYLIRCGAAADLRQFTATAPALCFGPKLRDLLDYTEQPLPAIWVHLNDPSSALFTCVWEATEAEGRPRESLFEAALYFQCYGSAQAVLSANAWTRVTADDFDHLLNARDQTGDTLYASVTCVLSTSGDVAHV
jgi:hypothetical protein